MSKGLADKTVQTKNLVKKNNNRYKRQSIIKTVFLVYMLVVLYVRYLFVF